MPNLLDILIHCAKDVNKSPVLKISQNTVPSRIILENIASSPNLEKYAANLAVVENIYKKQCKYI